VALNEKQARFAAEYLIDLNATQAAVRAGYSAQTAYSQGQRLLKHVEVAAAIAKAQEGRAERTQITADQVLTELAKLGFSDIRKAINWQANVVGMVEGEDGEQRLAVTNQVCIVDSDKIDDGTAAAIAEISQTDKGGLKVKFYDKRAALVDIGRHLGMFKDKVEHSGRRTHGVLMGADGFGGNARPVQRIVIPYLPRNVWRGFHESTVRWRVAVAHRRAGKTVAFVNEAIRGALTCSQPSPRFGYVAPYLSQAKAIAWDYVKRYCAPIPGVKFNEAELRADLPNGGRIRLFGADNPDSLRGLYFDGAILDEFGDMDPRVWTEVIRPALSDRHGWAAFAGTPRGKNAFYDLRNRGKRGEDDWQLWELKASQTGILSAEELADARASMDTAAYEREYECSFDASVEGAYYAKEMSDAESAKRLCRLPIEPTVKVDTAWDLGIDDATAIWFVQDIGQERRVIDYLEISGEGLPQIVKRLEAKDYRYDRHILPHDAEARELGTGKSRTETLEALGLRNLHVVPQQAVSDGINAVRLTLAKCWFDEDRCARGIEALKQYRREWDGKRQTWRERPLHDWSSHAADAFRYLSLARPAVKAPKALELPRQTFV
jgi:phage terminase large subunit